LAAQALAVSSATRFREKSAKPGSTNGRTLFANGVIALCCSVPNRENLVFRRLPLEADEVINDLEEKRQRPGCAVWWRSAGVVAIELDAVIREKAWARTAGP